MAEARITRRLALAGLVVGAWAILPPYSGPALNTSSRVEVADHVVPGVVVLLVSAATLAIARGGPRPGTLPFVLGLVVLLAGIWMTATHVPLVGQALREATRDQAPAGAVAYHTVPGLAVVALGVVWAAAHWSDVPS